MAMLEQLRRDFRTGSKKYLKTIFRRLVETVHGLPPGMTSSQGDEPPVKGMTSSQGDEHGYSQDKT